MDDALRMVNKLADAVSKPGLKRLGRLAKKQLEADTVAAFTSGRDPMTGRSWRRRKVAVPWRPLHKTGGLQQAIRADVEVYEDRLRVQSEVRDSRSGALSYHAIAGSLFFGRRRQSDVRSKKGKGGPMAARPFAGFSPAGTKRIQRKAAQLVKV